MHRHRAVRPRTSAHGEERLNPGLTLVKRGPSTGPLCPVPRPTVPSPSRRCAPGSARRGSAHGHCRCRRSFGCRHRATGCRHHRKHGAPSGTSAPAGCRHQICAHFPDPEHHRDGRAPAGVGPHHAPTRMCNARHVRSVVRSGAPAQGFAGQFAETRPIGFGKAAEMLETPVQRHLRDGGTRCTCP